MVDLEFEDGLAVLTIDRPHARNAISLDTMDQLEKHSTRQPAPRPWSSRAPAIGPSSPAVTSRN